MVPMPPDHPPAAAPPEAVIEFGPAPEELGEPSRRRRRWNPSGLLHGVANDRRVVPLAAAIGAVALFGSLISEWQVTEIDVANFNSTDAGLRPIPSDVIDLGSWGAGYLVGLFALVGAMVLVLFGPLSGRRYARLLGLSTGGLLLALLAALEPSLDEVSRTLGYAIRYQLSSDDLHIHTGRGVWCALLGVAAFMLALIVAGRQIPPDVTENAADPAASVAEPPAVWSWRRPPTAAEDAAERPPDAPFDLTVTPTKPFTSLDDNRDQES
jgi:hypothetical protein